MNRPYRACLPTLVAAFVATGCVITSSDDDDDTTSGATTPTGGTTSPSSETDTIADSTSAGSADTDAGDTTGETPSANDRCAPICDTLVAAGCDNGPTPDGCLLTCEALTSSATCDPSANVYFDCVDDQTVTCNAAGDPVAAGCGLAYLEAIDCAVSENPNPAIVEPCAEYCGNIEAAMCPANGSAGHRMGRRPGDTRRGRACGT